MAPTEKVHRSELSYSGEDNHFVNQSRMRIERGLGYGQRSKSGSRTANENGE